MIWMRSISGINLMADIAEMHVSGLKTVKVLDKNANSIYKRMCSICRQFI